MPDPTPTELAIAYYETAFEQYQRAMTALSAATGDAIDADVGWYALNAARVRVYQRLIAEDEAQVANVEQIKASLTALAERQP